MNASSDDIRTEKLNSEALDSCVTEQLHLLLYRQECRAWLLWCLLSLLLSLLMNAIFGDMPIWLIIPLLLVTILYACFVSFWVVGPSQELLHQLRERNGRERTRAIEKGFDDSWASVREFIPPLLLPPLLLIAIALFRIFSL